MKSVSQLGIQSVSVWEYSAGNVSQMFQWTDKFISRAVMIVQLNTCLQHHKRAQINQKISCFNQSVSKPASQSIVNPNLQLFVQLQHPAISHTAVVHAIHMHAVYLSQTQS